ncbi:LacI family DNA-binding transcriptional regulator [Clostridium thermarum]|uniref:LacI family DNA-binding transcriptional regulator n=1 Tax=Clostridium thermarum TaxID=1716543 RepID=UPI00111DD1C9|nr:LacI family DNA-binding transcriptional regulator [Clostridium thermarum]
MNKEKVTIQDIAHALGLSRNTVSKALNGHKSIPEATRSKVIEKAISLKYRHYALMDTKNLTQKRNCNIALITHHMPYANHFGNALLNELERKISAEGFTLSIYVVRDTEIDSLIFPNNFDEKKVDGIICIELFNKKYTELICKLNLPTILIDCVYDISFTELNADIILMENEHSTYALTKKLIADGHTNIGFIGDFKHCKSFNERWLGYNRALFECKLQLDLSSCILEDDDKYPYNDYIWIAEQIEKMKVLPSAFICANDFIAVTVMQALKHKGIEVPNEVSICGFDNALESRIIDPQLTTVHIYRKEMGLMAAEMLLSRLENPSKPFQITYVKTDPIFRESTASYIK